MFEVKNCDKCKHPMKLKLSNSALHLKCPECNTQYRLTQSSIKKEILVPLLAVAISVMLSIKLITTNDIFIKLIFILVLSALLQTVIDYILIKKHLLEYEVEENS